ncbi:C2 calcium-dependent domain-containing protein 4C-like [Pleurodeles waltl]|uniref:C2 calcium-dependent domain-containing protein 4C-like n=1 Tax=Pleurodeles waltl TaxID=8319 RepID=UPI0037095AE3
MPTYYGAVHLKESAHTRRKESLFHMDIVNVVQVSQEILNKRCPNSSCLHSLQTSLKVQPEINNSRCRPAKDEALAACGNQSEESSSSSPQLLRTRSGFSLFRYFSKDSSSYRVSTRKSKSSLEKNSLSTNQLTSEDGGRCSTIKSCSSCPNLLPLRASPFDYLRCQERLQREHVVKLDKRGIIRLSAEYSLDWATLRVRVITTEEIYEKSFKAKNVNCNVIVCLIPGKVQRQQSAIIKNSKNPIFNEDFFFDGIQKRDLKTLALKMKVINKGTSMKFDTVLGAKSLHLSELLPF